MMLRKRNKYDYNRVNSRNADVLLHRMGGGTLRDMCEARVEAKPYVAAWEAQMKDREFTAGYNDAMQGRGRDDRLVTPDHAYSALSMACATVDSHKDEDTIASLKKKLRCLTNGGVSAWYLDTTSPRYNTGRRAGFNNPQNSHANN